LQLPVALPESVLEKLFHACQASLHQANQKGRQLVAAVESLFPESHQLNDMVGMMLLGAARDEEGGKTWILGQVPQSYETASPQQQLALTLLAADQILFNLLSLDLSPSCPQSTHAWETELGTLTLQATVTVSPQTHPSLELIAVLPCSGTLHLGVPQPDGQRQWSSQSRGEAGTLRWTIPLTPGVQPSVQIPLRVCLDHEIPEVNFMVRWTEQPEF